MTEPVNEFIEIRKLEKIDRAKHWHKERKRWIREMKDRIVAELEGRFDLEEERWK